MNLKDHRLCTVGILLILLFSLVLIACSREKTPAAYNTYQYLVSSANGLGSDDAAAIRRIQGVRYCEGGFALHGSTEWEGNPISVWYRSIPVKLTNLTLTQGRMPVRVGEAAVSSELFTQSGFCLGDWLPVDETVLYCDALTIVGVVEDAWETEPALYMSGDSFRQTGYSHIYVLVPDAEKETAVGADLMALAEKREAAWLEKETKRIQEDIAAKKTEYDALDDSLRWPLEEERAKLSDARNALEENRRKLINENNQLQNARAQLSDAKDQLSSGREQLKKARAELDAAKKALEDYGAQLDSAKQEIEEKRRQLAAFQHQLDSLRSTYQNALATNGMTDEQLEAAYQEASTSLDDANAELSEANAAIVQCNSNIQESQAEISSAQDRISEIQTQMEETTDEEVCAKLATELLLQQLRLSGAQAVQRGLIAKRNLLVETQYQLQERVSVLQETKDSLGGLITLREQLRSAEAEYAAGAAALRAAEEQYYAMRAEYQSQTAVYTANEGLYATNSAELDRKEHDYELRLSYYQSNMRIYTQQETAFLEKEQELLDAEQQFSDAEQDLLDQMKPIEDEMQALEAQLNQISAPEWMIQSWSSKENG